MGDWKANSEFLDFLLEKFKQEGTDLDQPLFTYGFEAYSVKELIEEMHRGSEIGKKIYSEMFALYRLKFKKIKY